MSEFKMTAKQGQRLFARVDDLEKRVRALERGEKAKPAPAPAPKESPKEDPPPAAPKQAGFLEKLKGW